MTAVTTTYWSRQSPVMLPGQRVIFCSASGGRRVCVCLPSRAWRSWQPWKRARSFVFLARFLGPIASSLNPQFRHSSLQFSPAGESVFGVVLAPPKTANSSFCFGEEPDAGNRHGFVDGFAHVVDGRGGDSDCGELFHFDAGGSLPHSVFMVV